MKKISILFILSILVNVSFGQSWGSGISGDGSVISKTIDLPSFSGIVLNINADVDLNRGKQSFDVLAQPNIIDNLKLEVKDNVLHIGYDKNVKNAKSPRFSISIPNVHKLVVTGSGDMVARGFDKQDQLKLKVTGSGSIDIDNGAAEMEVKISGSGDIKISGTADTGEFGVTGSGDIDAENLTIAEASASITGSGDISLACKETMNVKITGSGDVDVYGNPKLISRVTGSGDVTEH